jgi:hypothetical protein
MHLPDLAADAAADRWVRTTQPLADQPPPQQRLQACPPSLRQAPDSWMERIWFWLAAPTDAREAAPPLARLPGVRGDFLAMLADVEGLAGHELKRRVSLSRSLRELWHLRTEVYRLVAVQHSQSEAESRLADLNRHFPTRAPRSGFAPL